MGFERLLPKPCAEAGLHGAGPTQDSCRVSPLMQMRWGRRTLDRLQLLVLGRQRSMLAAGVAPAPPRASTRTTTLPNRSAHAGSM